ncbi:MAG TPA: hypothetical protein VGI48_17675, partial [Caldimonas sp.]
AHAQWRELDEHLAWCDERIAEHTRTNEQVKTATTLLGVGPLTASAVVAGTTAAVGAEHAARPRLCALGRSQSFAVAAV